MIVQPHEVLAANLCVAVGAVEVGGAGGGIVSWTQWRTGRTDGSDIEQAASRKQPRTSFNHISGRAKDTSLIFECARHGDQLQRASVCVRPLPCDGGTGGETAERWLVPSNIYELAVSDCGQSARHVHLMANGSCVQRMRRGGVT